MKFYLVFLIGLPIIVLSFQTQDNIGKEIFDSNCKSCHSPNKSTDFVPSFQNIRNDYGLKWILEFLKNGEKMRNRKDIQALYSYYLFGRKSHTVFPVLDSEYVIKVLDYVDNFPVDASKYKHRAVSYQEKKKFVLQQSRVVIRPDNNGSGNLDALEYSMDDTLRVEKKRTSTHRKTSKN